MKTSSQKKFSKQVKDASAARRLEEGVQTYWKVQKQWNDPTNSPAVYTYEGVNKVLGKMTTDIMLPKKFRKLVGELQQEIIQNCPAPKKARKAQSHTRTVISLK